MKKGKQILRQEIEKVHAKVDAFPGVPLVEIAGNSRVLIENHMGILEYGYENIIVKLNYGTLCVCGANLTMAQMTKHQLVILGSIHSLSITKGGWK